MARARIHPKVYNCLNCKAECKYCGHKANKYCSVKCQKEYEIKLKLEKWLNGEDVSSLSRGVPRSIRQYILEKQNFKCKECEIKDWQGKSIVFELDHIDGNSENNKEDNLRLICPNCHSQSPTYKSKNKGKGRASRVKRYKDGKSY